MNYFQQLKEKHGKLDPEQEQIKKWYKQGFRGLSEGEPKEAEEYFEKLSVARPWQHGGFEGLAYVYYDTGRLKESEWFMMKALSIAEAIHRRDKMDDQIVEMLQWNLKAMRDESEIFRWWEE